MSGVVTITGSVSGSYSGQVLDIVSGSPTINGGSDTVQSAASGIGIVLTGGNNAITISGSSDTLMAGEAITGGVSGDTLLLTGNYNVIEDSGFSGGGVTIDGSGNFFSSQQRIETSNVVINGSNDTVSAIYMGGNFLITGNNVLIDANNGAFTVAGANDTVVAANAQSILVTGSNATVVDEARPGSTLPTSLLAGADQASQDTTPGTTISITGSASGASVTTYNNNNTVASSGSGSSVSLQSYGNSATLAGGNSSISAQSQTETISVAGAQDTVSTSQFSGGGSSSTVPASTVSVDSVVASSTTYNAGTSGIVDTTPGSGASIVNITSGGTSIVATVGGTFNDSIGGNSYTIGGGTKLDFSSGNNTVTVSDGQFLTQDTLGGAAGSPNTIFLGSNSVVDLTTTGVAAEYDQLSVTGSGNSGFIYNANNALYLGGSGNLFAVLANPATSSTTGGLLSVSGADTLSIWSGNNSIIANNGAALFVTSNNNTISGGNASLVLEGGGNIANLTGQSTISSASPWQYGAAGSGGVQNQFTVQGGQFNLGGEDSLLQTGSSAVLTLAGGNNVSLYGANDSITASDQLYGGNN
ncbi:MAG: hypothetical protein KGJ73_05195, partial [Rhodospirillales bacterium]|nr:hypothetical protein [Rhodospirillales bacterium]